MATFLIMVIFAFIGIISIIVYTLASIVDKYNNKYPEVIDCGCTHFNGECINCDR